MEQVQAEYAGACERPMTLKDRIRMRLFPTTICPLPSAPAELEKSADCIGLQNVTRFSLADRIRVLLSGRIVEQSYIVTKYSVGACVSSSVVYVLPFKMLEAKAEKK